jgi:hypothetical protein
MTFKFFRWIKPDRLLFPVIFGAIVLVGSIIAPFCQLDTEPANWDISLVFAALIVAPLSIWSTAKSVRYKKLPLKMALFPYIIAVAFGPVLYWSIFRILVPPYITYTVSYPGNVGSYHKVQFYFKNNGQWLEGPSVEGWPMTLSFPDLNGDGHRDIKVTKSDDKTFVEFIYLPRNDGRCFWRPILNNSSLSAGYPPAQYYSNYP